MGTYGYFKIESEVEDKIDLGGDGVFDNTEFRIFRVDPEMYEEDFEKLLLEFGRPLNTSTDFADFQIWLIKDKKLNVTTAEFNFLQNYTELKAREH
jgi:hypothetical protein